MVGFGAGLCYPAGILIVNEYFNDHRGLANGLSLVGTTIGSFAMPPYLKFLTTSYGYRYFYNIILIMYPTRYSVVLEVVLYFYNQRSQFSSVFTSHDFFFFNESL